MGFVHIKPAGHETVSMPEFRRGVLGIMVKEQERDASVDWSTTFGGSAEEQNWFEHWVIQLWSATKSESQQRPCWYFDFCWDGLTPQSICLFQDRISTRRVIEFKCWPSSATVDKRIHPTGPNRPCDHTGYPPLKAWNIHHWLPWFFHVYPLSSMFWVKTPPFVGIFHRISALSATRAGLRWSSLYDWQAPSVDSHMYGSGSLAHRGIVACPRTWTLDLRGGFTIPKWGISGGL